MEFTPLIGEPGIQFIQSVFAQGPKKGLDAVNNAALLQHPLCKPLMGMVDSMGTARLEAHKAVLFSAKQMLLDHVEKKLQKDKDRAKLERLLAACFIYLGVPELKDVPLAIMNAMDNVPANWLKQLAVDKEIFKDLPAKVQRQVWEFDKNLMQKHALPLVSNYKHETAVFLRALAMDEFISSTFAALTAQQSSGGPGDGEEQSDIKHFGVTRKVLRKGSRTIQLLKEMVGGSLKLYQQLVELCMVKFKQTGSLYVSIRDVSYCSLRSQILMALHDDNNPVAKMDKCHDLAWTLDAGIKNGFLTEKHVQRLEKWVADIVRVEAPTAASTKGKTTGRPRAQVVEDEAESAGNVLGTGNIVPLKVLGDAGSILRDPSTMHLLVADIIASLHVVVQAEQMPADSQRISFLLRLLQLAMDCKAQLREGKFRWPEADQEVVHHLLPVLAGYIVDFMVAGWHPPDTWKAEDPDVSLGMPDLATERLIQALLKKSELARKLCEMFVLERLQNKDYLSVLRVLMLLVPVSYQPLAVAEMAPFCATLAQRLAELIQLPHPAQRLSPGTKIWTYAVENLLLKMVDSHTQAHEEVLRFLLQAGREYMSPDPQQPGPLTVEAMGQYLSLCLQNSKQSRQRYQKRKPNPLADFPMTLTSDVGTDVGSEGWPGMFDRHKQRTDGVSSVYNEFRKMFGPFGLDQHVAPDLYSYLHEIDEQEQDADQWEAVPAAKRIRLS